VQETCARQVQSSASCPIVTFGSEKAAGIRTTSGFRWWRKQSLVTNEIVGAIISTVDPGYIQSLLQSESSVSRERSGMLNSS